MNGGVYLPVVLKKSKFAMYSPAVRFVQGESLTDLDGGHYSLIELLDNDGNDVWLHVEDASPAEEEILVSVQHFV